MKVLLSPSKSVTNRTPPVAVAPTNPLFPEQTKTLISVLAGLGSVEAVAALLNVSDTIALLNHERFQDWNSAPEQRSAIWMYSGDVYNGLDAFTLNGQDIERAQRDVLIISGLYGLLRPLDLVQPYRLDMGTRLAGPWGKNLYQFWGKTLAGYIDEQAAAAVVVCASREYAQAVVPHLSGVATVITPRFLRPTPNGLREQSLFAKHFRGVLARWILDQQPERVDDLHDFNAEGISYGSEHSVTNAEPIFLIPEDFTLKGRFTKG